MLILIGIALFLAVAWLTGGFEPKTLRYPTREDVR